MGCPQAGAGSTQVYRRDGACCQPRSTRRHLHEPIDSSGFGRPHQSAPVHAPSRSADRLSPFHIRPGRIAGPHSLPSRQFQALFDSLFQSPFHLSLAGTCLLSVSRRYLALDGIYRPIGAAFPPNNHDSQTAPCGATGSGHDGALTLSGAPSRGLGPGPPAEDASPDYNSDSEAARFSSWADPGFARRY
ncbi:hypothetical protein L2E82_52876 [Cichorium intybus]|nr:hypothetical protein L2E82_52876 [Cichorium intybus]